MQTVAQLDEHRKNRKRHPDGVRLRAVGSRFQEMVPVLLDTFFSQADDFLFNLAEKGGPGSSNYFDVLRVLRRRKSELCVNVVQQVEDWLSSGAQTLQSNKDQAAGLITDFNSLSLMDDDELERRLAVESFATRTYERAGDDWLAFRERMLVLTCKKQLKNSETPYNPEVLGQIFFAELESVDAPFKITLMLFRLFDDLAIQRVTGFYRSSNVWLVEEGILPTLKLLQAQQTAHTPINDQTIAQISASLASAVFSANNQPGLGATPPGFPAAADSNFSLGSAAPAVAGAAQYAGNSGVMVDAGLLQQMMLSMTQIQNQPAPAASDMAGLKGWAVQQAQTVVRQAQGSLEAGTVSLVAMLFEYILDDENLSAHMKQLLARMQIPIIKVALLDKDFFTDTDHDARLLLNRMARAASGWHPDADLEGDSLLAGMEKIVVQLNHDFDDDLGIFTTLLAEFESLLASYHVQQQEQIESIRLNEEKAYEQHQQQDRARLFIDTLLENEQLPADIEALLTGHWYRLMKNIFSQQGESKSWRTSARIARELVWSMQPSVQLTQMSRFKTVVPKLLDGFASGLKGAGLASDQIGNAIAVVENYHNLYKDPLNENVWEAQAKLEEFDGQAEKAEELVNAPAPLPIDEPVVKMKSADLSYYLDQVESLTTDQWFDIELSDGHIERGCLSLIIGDGSKYVFTDHNGDKLIERSAIGLAMSIRNEQFIMLSEDPLLDRMIDSLVDDLGNSSNLH